MNAQRLALLVAALVVAAAGAAASPVESFASVVTGPLRQVAKAKPRTVRVDVDGDGRKDTVKLSRVRIASGDGIWKLSVKTAKKSSASLTFRVWTIAVGQPPGTASVWYGTAPIDGDKGSEIIVRTEDLNVVLVVGWRAGKLVAEPLSHPDWSSDQPGRVAAGKAWPLGGNDSEMSYRLTGSGATRTIEANLASCPTDTADCVDTQTWRLDTVRSVWRNHAWRRAAVASSQLVADQADPYFAGEFTGVAVKNR